MQIIPVQYTDATPLEIDHAVRSATQAFIPYKNLSLQARHSFIHAIANALESKAPELVSQAVSETHLGIDRLKGELGRTCFQLRSYSDAALAGRHLDPRIDTALPDRQPAPRVDIRKMMVPLGPVVVFGSSNFPFAYSTAGGDTACALAAGCPVIVKAHPAHAGTSEMVAGVIAGVVKSHGLPEGVFVHLHGAAFDMGSALVRHSGVKAVGFTGSTSGGRALFDLANSRPDPIPVFSEMGSTNPVFLLPGKLKTSAEEMGAQYAASITLGVGQFCTNPGLLIAIKGSGLEAFVSELGKRIAQVSGAPMLHAGIAKAYAEKRAAALAQAGVAIVAVGAGGEATGAVRTGGAPTVGVAQADAANRQTGLPEGLPTIARTQAKAFLSNPLLHAEVFGPYSLLVECDDASEMQAVAVHIDGQLTSTLMASEEDFKAHSELVETLVQRCGRFIWNGVPTGVEVVPSMQHGGPYPATTDSRFTSVGEDGIRRFMRPVCYQNFPDHLLPEALQAANPLGLWRLVNGEWTKSA